jgi:hypothetical protein
MANGDPSTTIETSDALTLEEQMELGSPASFVPSDGGPIELIEQEDGGVIVDFDPASKEIDDSDFFRNLAEEMDDSDLGRICSDLLNEFQNNKTSRQEWENTYSNGMELLGYVYEERTMPFRGATGVTHPLLAEAATQFQAQAFNELLPSDGPVRTTIMGERTKEKEQQALRVKEFMNYYITDVMEEYTPEFDQMLFFLPLAGSTFKKVYYDEGLDRAVSRFVPAEQLVVPYETSSLETCPCITNIVPMDLNEVRKLQLSGFYQDTPLFPSLPSGNEITQEQDKIQGVGPTNSEYDVNLLEFHVDLDLDGFEELDEEGEPTGIKIPYLVTIAEDSNKILSIRRNYKEDDERKVKIQYFVHYKFLPGFGFYGLGLIHAIGGLSRTATAALRQLIDAGTLSNLPAGFKARGLRVANDSDPLQPGEFRDVDAPGGVIRDSLMPLPFKGPDQTLFQLLSFVVDAGQRFATITDLKVGDGNQAAAVGTTVAMLEQGSRVMSAVHKRLHYSLRKEFKVLARVMHESLPQKYPFSVAGGDREVMAEDFDDRIDILPVSNPSIFSQSQRIALAQAQLELSMQAPELHNSYEAFRRMYEALGVRDIDKILKVPSSEQPIPKDPAQENIDVLENVDLEAFEGQNHDAHIMAHLVLGASPIVSQSPNIVTAIQKHITQHVKLKAQEITMVEFEKASDQEVPDDAMLLDMEIYSAQLIAQELQKVRQLSQSIVNGPGAEEEGADPLIDLKQQEIDIKGQKTQADIARDQGKLSLEEQKVAQRGEQFDERLDSQEKQTTERIQASDRREMMRLRQKAGETP